MNSSDLDAAVGRGLDFLRRSQLPWGEFKVYMTVIDYAETGGVLDSCVFPTALIAYSLGFDDSGASREMLDKSVRFLLGEMEGPGLWRYWTKQREYQATITEWEKLHMFQFVMPPDLDDIACVSYVLRREGVPFPSNLKLIFANRDPRGLFYTWLTLRWPPPLMPAYLRTVLPQWRHPLMLPAYWKLTPSMPDDVDCVVNANVLFYAGAGPEMRPVIDYLTDITRRGEGHRCDKWHRNTEDVAGVWKTHHALVLPSRAEGLPLSLVEAMMCGRPGLVTRVGGNGEVLEDGVTGFLAAPAEDPLDAALDAAWARRGDLAGMGRLAATRIRELFPPDPARDFADALLEVAGAAASRASRKARGVEAAETPLGRGEVGR